MIVTSDNKSGYKRNEQVTHSPRHKAVRATDPNRSPGDAKVKVRVAQTLTSPNAGYLAAEDSKIKGKTRRADMPNSFPTFSDLSNTYLFP